jgi:hypothetical protein
MIYSGYAQDTTEFFKYYDGSKSFKISTKKDTCITYIYPNGKKESVHQIKRAEKTGYYCRWYANSKLMWRMELKNGVQNGKSVFYDASGKRVAELMYINGKITDTLFVKTNTHLVFGKITSSSKVYGGMERENGSADVSEFSSAYMNFWMYAALVDSIKKPKLVSFFKSDFNGNFFILVPEGKIGFYPKSVKIEYLTPSDYKIPEENVFHGEEGWSKQGPIIVKKGDKIQFIELHHFSIGYAP